MKVFKIITEWIPNDESENEELAQGIVFNDGTTVCQFRFPKKHLSVWKSFKDFRNAEKEFLEQDKRRKLLIFEVW